MQISRISNPTRRQRTLFQENANASRILMPEILRANRFGLN